MHRCTAPAVCGLVMLAVGCSHSKLPATAKVSGIVTYNGNPVDGATVIFAPLAGGRPATATSESDGRYDLTTFNDRDGAMPGQYKVTVMKTVAEGQAQDLTNEKANELQSQGIPLPVAAVRNVLPEKYADGNTSDLNFTVKTGGNDIPLELKD